MKNNVIANVIFTTKKQRVLLFFYRCYYTWRPFKKINNASLSGMLNVTKSDKKRAVTSVLVVFILYVTLSFPVLDTARGRQPYQYGFFHAPQF